MTITSTKTADRSSDPAAAPSPRASESSAAIVDLIPLREICDGDAAVAAEIIQDFGESAAEIVSRAEAAIAERDAAAAMRAAHTLKGSSGILGATAIHHHAEAVERAAASGDLAAASRSLDEIRALTERTIAILRADIDRMNGR